MVRAEPDDLFNRTVSLALRPRTVHELPGGLTNRNYKVTTPDGSFVARLSGAGSELLAIDRDCEYRNSVAAAAAGAGPPVVEYRPQDSMLIIGYIEGRTLGSADVAEPRTITRIARACRGCTRARGSATTSTCSPSSGGTWRCTTRGFRIPAGYEDLLPHFDAIAAALTASDRDGTVPCNNDLCPPTSSTTATGSG